MTAPLLPAPYRHVEFDEIDSTNEEAKRRAAQGERGPLWISARTQTAGRGRRGREWHSQAGNLMATLLLEPKCSAPDAALLSFVTALAVHETVCSWIDPADVKVKWPNDVLVKGRKISGILLESATVGDDRVVPWLAIGVGLNLVYAPEIANYPATCVKAHANPPKISEALSVLARNWDTRFQAWTQMGFEPIRADWLKVAAGLQQEVEVRLANETFKGTFSGLMANGELKVTMSSGQSKTVSAGEVFFPDMKGGSDAARD